LRYRTRPNAAPWGVGTILWATTLSNPNERAEALAVNGSQVFVLDPWGPRES
jgi:hypothetical protein